MKWGYYLIGAIDDYSGAGYVMVSGIEWLFCKYLQLLLLLLRLLSTLSLRVLLVLFDLVECLVPAKFIQTSVSNCVFM